MKCLDLYIWKPERRNARNREPTNIVLGITNYDRCSKTYHLIGETDTKNIDLERIKPLAYMIVETRKGYHFYLRYHHRNPLRVVHTGFKTKLLDKGQLKLALKRYRLTQDPKRAFLVLRVSPKYNEPDLRIIYVSSDAPEWVRQVEKIISFFNQLP